MPSENDEPSARYLAVLDFEATCAERDEDPEWDSGLQEIIEVPVGLISVGDLAVVDTFGSFVRPTRQPTLTGFCTRFTSIRQSDVDQSPPIAEVMPKLLAWFGQRGAAANNTVLVTCGDWDLRRMWARQASLVPGLHTPALFKTWCNLKFAYARHTGERPSGMMSMLRGLDIPHEGHHHRGADDVRNLCAVTLRLLREGASFAPTWTAEEGRAEQERWAARQTDARDKLAKKRESLSKLPAQRHDVRRRFEEQIERYEEEASRFGRLTAVFDHPGP